MMRLVCVSCGNYVHFEVEVEMVRSIRSTPQGFSVESFQDEGWDESEASVRMGVVDIVDYCTKVDMDAMHWDAKKGYYVSTHVTCARCGSRRVCIPFQPWSPPTSHVSLDEELTHNRHEFQWLRKERAKHANQLPQLQ